MINFFQSANISYRFTSDADNE